MARTRGKPREARVGAGRSRRGSMSPERSGRAWWGGGKYRVLRERSHPNMGRENFSDDEELADYLGMVLGYWLRRDKMLPEQYRSAEKLREAIVAQVCD